MAARSKNTYTLICHYPFFFASTPRANVPAGPVSGAKANKILLIAAHTHEHGEQHPPGVGWHTGNPSLRIFRPTQTPRGFCSTGTIDCDANLTGEAADTWS